MARLPKQKFVKFVRSKGEVYAYFNTGKKDLDGKRIYVPMGKASSEGYQDTYVTMMGHRTRRSQTLLTVSDLADKSRIALNLPRTQKGRAAFTTVY